MKNILEYLERNKKIRKVYNSSKIDKNSTDGITLIALVVTIIVLIILAGISIGMLTGENGIITKASEAKLATQIAEEQEKVNFAAIAAKVENNGEEITEKNLENELNKTIGLRDVVYKLEKEGNQFIVTYIDTQRSYKVDSDKKIENITITFTYSPDNWTNGNVVVTASTDMTEYTLQTSIDGQNWMEESSQTYSQNGKVYARLVDDGTQVGEVVEGEVTKIDTVEPEVGTIKVIRENLSTAETEEIFADEEGNFTTVSSRTVQDIQYKLNIELCNGNDDDSGHKSTTYTIEMNGTICYANITEPVTLTGTSANLSRAIVAPEPAESYDIIVTTEDNAGNISTKTYYISSSIFY